jgi:hypothetical protein
MELRPPTNKFPDFTYLTVMIHSNYILIIT